MRAFLLLVFLSGCGHLSSGGGPTGDARAATASLAGHYERARAEDFFAGVDQSEFPNVENFRYRVRQFLLKNRQITLDLRPDSVSAEGDRASVEAKWNKSFVDPDGVLRSEDGVCELMFRKRASGGYALTSIRGETPF